MNRNQENRLKSQKQARSKIFCAGFAFLFCVSFAMMPALASAATYFITSGADKFSVGSEFLADVIVDVEGETLNAFGGVLVYPENILSAVEVRDADSVVTFWAEKPTAQKESGRIAFSGIVPGGYLNESGKLFSVVFRTKKEGSGRVYFEGTQALLNDGLGTAAITGSKDLLFTVPEQGGRETIVPIIIDNDLPDRFSPEIAKDKNIFNGQWFLVFATQDRGSGIDHYEIREDSPAISPWIGTWITAESPYLLQDQSLKSRIFIKAVDRSGNERIGVLEAQNKTPWYEKYPIWGIIVIGAVLLLFALILMKKKIIRH